MFARVSCPTCQYQDSIPEGEMGHRRICPNCKTPFLAGKSVVDNAPVSTKPQPAPDPTYNKTMLAGDQPSISYNCPRCKKGLESPANEAGIKKNCPHCGQRLQVPAAPPPPAAAAPPNLNKTMLVPDESPPQPPIRYNCPNCKKQLEAPASEALTKKNCPYCSQRLQVPAAPPPDPRQPNLNKTKLATDESKATPSGYPGGQPMATSGTSPAPQTTAPANQNWGAWLHSPQGYATTIVTLLLLVFVIPAVLRGGKREDSAALKEIERVKAEAEQKRLEFERQLAQQKQFELLIAQQKAQADRDREDFRNLISSLNNQQLKDKAQEEFNRKQRELEEEKRANQLKFDQLQQQILEAKKAAENAKQNAQTVIQQQPPVVVYPPYHRRYWEWWW